MNWVERKTEEMSDGISYFNFWPHNQNPSSPNKITATHLPLSTAQLNRHRELTSFSRTPPPFASTNYSLAHQKMATKLLISPLSPRCTFSSQEQQHIHSWPGCGRVPKRQRSPTVRLSTSVSDALSSSSDILEHFPQHTQSLFLLAESGGYSLASYYTSLGLFVISVPGLWSLIKRSVKSKVVKKTFIGEGEGKKAPSQVAGEILSFFTRNNFVVSDRGETVVFEGIMVPNRGQAALLTFCTCISLASVALVLTITYPDVGNNWFWLTLLSPLAGAYYWTKASRKEQIKVKVLVGEDGSLSEIIVQGDDQQVEEMRRELQLSEKGMVYVKGIFER